MRMAQEASKAKIVYHALPAKQERCKELLRQVPPIPLPKSFEQFCHRLWDEMAKGCSKLTYF
jgi:hypothetical protein